MEQVNNAVEFWGTIGKQNVFLYHLQNQNGIRVSISNFGATVTSIITPDKNNNLADIALGYDTLDGYINDEHYIGGIVGRFANRIAGGLVELDGKKYQLTTKPGGYHHHGGSIGFNKKVWEAELFVNNGSPAVIMHYLSPDGEEGFPGNLFTTLTYTLDNHDRLILDIRATTDKDTLINLTQHSYFNLSGHNSGNVLKQELMLPHQSYLPVNTMHVPTGNMADVADSPFDFREKKPLGTDIDNQHPMLLLGKGYDNTWVIKSKSSLALKVAGRVTDNETGRALTVYTTEPSVHLYTGNFLDGVYGKEDAVYNKRDGFCLETQHYPDAPNHPHFPGTVLKKCTEYKSKTIFEFNKYAICQ